MDAPAVQPFPAPSTDYSMAFRLLIVSAIPAILVFLLCLFFPKASIRYDDHDPETATDTHHHHHHDHYHHFQLRSDDTERVREFIEGLKRAMLEASDGFVYDKTKASKKDNNGGDAECAICLDDFKDGDVCRALDECDHVFHKGCVIPWLMKSNTCPLCRVVVPHGWDLPD